MSLSRRQVVEAGVAAGTLAVMASSPVLAAVVTPHPAQAPVPAAPTVVPARPRVTVDPIIDSRLVSRARASFDRHRSRLTNTEVVAIADFTKSSSLPRFYLLDTNTGHVTPHLVCHGRGSDPAHTGYLQRFSNVIGSEASSDGAYVIGPYYEGKYGRSLRVDGLDPSNNNAEARAIVIHTAWYAEPEIVARTGRLGRSEGCFAMPRASLAEVLHRLGPGHFLYADKLA
jgi:hypothetical protein